MKSTATDPVGPPEPSPLSSRLSDLCLFAVVLLAPLAVGTVHPASWAVALVLSMVAWLLALHSAAQPARPQPIILALIGLTGIATLLPLLPIPAPLLDIISPLAAEQWSRGLPGTEAQTRWGPLHRAPGPGLYAVLRWCAAVSFLLACTVRGASSQWRDKASNWVLLSGGLAVIVCIAQTTTGMTSILGLYTPRVTIPLVMHPTFINENHWTGFLGIILTVSLAAITRGKSAPLQSALTAALAVAVSIMVLVTPSDSGLFGAGAGVAALLLLQAKSTARTHTTKARLKAALRPIAAVTIVVSALGWFMARYSAKTDPESGASIAALADEPRLMWLPDCIDLIFAHRWTGVGVGGFLDSFAEFRSTVGRSVAYQPEMLPVQLLAENGVLLGSALLIVVCVILWLSLTHTHQSHVRMGASAALISLFVHEQADFASHVGGVLLPTLMLLVVALPPRRNDRSPRSIHLCAATLLLTTAVIVSPSLGHWDLTSSLRRAQLPDPATAEELEQASIKLWQAHPSSFLLAQELGRKFAAAGEANRALAWFNRAMLLAPHHPDPHLMTARLLRGLDAPKQALIEYGLGLRNSPEALQDEVLSELLSDDTDVALIAAALPADQPQLLSRVAEQAIWNRDPRATALAELAFARHPETPRAAYVKARVLLDTGHRDQAQELARTALMELSLSDGLEYRLLQVLWNSGGQDLAVQRLHLLLERTLEVSADAHLSLAQWRNQLGQPDLARVALRAARQGPPQTAARSRLLAAQIEGTNNGASVALGLIREAQMLDPSLAEAWLAEGQLLLKIGARQEARQRIELSPPGLRQTAAGRALLDSLGLTEPDTSRTESGQQGEQRR